jgi:hypothetical protein
MLGGVGSGERAVLVVAGSKSVMNGNGEEG